MDENKINEAFNKLLGDAQVPEGIEEEKEEAGKFPLSDDQISKLMEILNDNRSEESTLMKDLEDGTIVPEEKDDEKVDEYTSIMNELGEIDTEIPNFADISLDNISDYNLTDEVLNADLFKKSGLNDDDAMCIVSLINKKRAGNNFSVYNEMTPGLKSMVNSLAATSGANKGTIAKDLLENFMRDAVVEQEYIDFNAAIAKEMELDSTVELYTGEIKNKLEKELVEIADTIEAEKPEKAEQLRAISAAFTDSYKFTTVKDALTNNAIVRRKYRKDAINNFDRVISDFNYKYEKSKFSITNIGCMVNTLHKVFPDVDIKYIKEFIVVLCKAFMNYNPEIVEQHVVMYYTVTNILNLEFIKNIDDVEFYAELKNNVFEVINILINMEANRNVAGN